MLSEMDPYWLEYTYQNTRNHVVTILESFLFHHLSCVQSSGMSREPAGTCSPIPWHYAQEKKWHSMIAYPLVHFKKSKHILNYWQSPSSITLRIRMWHCSSSLQQPEETNSRGIIDSKVCKRNYSPMESRRQIQPSSGAAESCRQPKPQQLPECKQSYSSSVHFLSFLS